MSTQNEETPAQKLAQVIADWYDSYVCDGLLERCEEGINLATAAKDARISEMEGNAKKAAIRLKECKEYLGRAELDCAQATGLHVKEREERQRILLDSESKDLEIERLTAEVIAFEFEENTSKHLLTEANAKLAEAEEDAERYKRAFNINTSELDTTLAKLSFAQAEIERLKGQLNKATKDVEADYAAQLAEDRDEHDKQRIRDCQTPPTNETP